MTTDTLLSASLRIARITPKTQWAFIELEMSSGLRGVGEATAQGLESVLIERFPAMVRPFVGLTDAAVRETIGTMSLPSLAEAAIASAVDQASWDVGGKRRDVSVAAAAGVQQRTEVGVYANINRRTLDRSPVGFAASAADALAAGHAAIKIAPFDEVTPDAVRTDDLSAAIAAGLDRIRAVREKIGGRRLMVDCHWRFDLASARYVIAAAVELGVHWIECPLPETDEHLAELRTLREEANRRGVLLAGCEEMIRRKGFAPFLSAGVYDVIMPDVKYAGGLEEMLKLADLAKTQGVEISLHNPSGPVCHAASLQFTAMLETPDLLEMQFDETPLFDGLLKKPLPPIENGKARLPDAPGLGVRLDDHVLSTIINAESVAG